ncbi:hypothetical protein DPMN_182357 [Dreissena polymorpha]|uniref:Uncharacterized protein n=1 Tax=Dreissena polymorpha TaxID=45954 RepID=A0A9D4DH02_DREPO|nr:hypothetical protein DPMN_182357 [Dreissena polymorpha]
MILQSSQAIVHVQQAQARTAATSQPLFMLWHKHGAMESLEKPVQTRIGCGVEVQGQLCGMRSLITLTSTDPSQTMHH